MSAAQLYMLMGVGTKHSVAVKLNKYKSQYVSKSFGFVPAAIEITGRWSKQLSKLVVSIRKAGVSHNGRSMA